MLKRLALLVSMTVAMIWSLTVFAENVGIVDMRVVFQSSPQVKQVNAKLEKQFAPQQQQIMQMGQDLQTNIKKLQRNESVMDKASLEKLRNAIAGQEKNLQDAQTKFQQALFTAQNQAMGQLMDQVTAVVKQIADKKNLEVVLPKNAVLYAKDGMDITQDVLTGMNH